MSDHTTLSAADASARRRLLGASVAGASLEFYDFFIYGTAASIVFPKLFFPGDNQTVGLLLALGTYALGYANRPLGAMLFGHIGDRVGRKLAFSSALLTMGIATTLVGFLPSYATIGVTAPIILTILRFAQGLGLGGAWGGAAVMVTETYPANKRGFYGSLVQESSPIGLLIGSGVFALMTAILAPDAFEAWGWRIPFFASIILVGVGLYTHKVVEESPIFEELEEKHGEAKTPLKEVFGSHWKQLLIAVGARFGSDATFYIFGLFTLVYATVFLGMPDSVALTAVIAGGIAQLIGIPIFGALSDRIGRRPVLIIGISGCLVWAFFHFRLIGTKEPTLVVVAVFVGLFIHSAAWAPIAAFLAELFDTRVRYSGTAIGFQLAAVIGGAIAPLVATAIAVSLAHGLAISFYVAGMMIIGLIAVGLARETRNRSFHPTEELPSAGGNLKPQTDS